MSKRTKYQFDYYPIEHCRDCPCSEWYEDDTDQRNSGYQCEVQGGIYCPKDGKREDCPLVEVAVESEKK